MRRPTPVNVAFWLTIVSVIVNLVAGVILLVSGFALIGNGLFAEPAYAAQAYAAIVSIVLSIVLLFIALAMRRGANWARWTIIVLLALTLITATMQLFTGGPSGAFGIATVVVSIAVIALLLSRPAAAFFRA